ncbi:MAG: M14 metallopeptidase family protein [Candidatus Krumholzibacteriia bacterium]
MGTSRHRERHGRARRLLGGCALAAALASGSTVARPGAASAQASSAALAAPASVSAGEPTTPISPEKFLGFPVGADRELADYNQILGYLERLDAASERLELREYGRSTLGAPLVMVLISTAENLRNAERYREISARLAHPRGLGDAEAEKLVRDGKAILLVVCNIHSTEIGSSQMILQWAYDLVTTQDPRVLAWLQEVVLLVVPSVNPDGQIIVTEWYRKHVGTRHEGGPMPWLYHVYAGHDLNRDWFMLTQKETRALNRVAYREWFPQVLVDEHQMGTTGPRVFVPPYANPVAENVHALIWRLTALVGSNMALRLEEAGKTGVIYGYTFDGYWVGGTRSTCFWKNTVGILTEVASARIASPVHVDPMELRGNRKGLPEYRAQVNFPNPWPGGWWRLRDIVDYDLVVSNSALETCARHREDLLRNRLELARDALERGRSEPPYAYVVPPDQHDERTAAWMVDLLRENGIEAYLAQSALHVDGQVFPAGSVVLPTAQPHRAFLKEMMETQSYPEIAYGPDSDEIFRPYDVTGWTLPLLMGVDWVTVDAPFDVPLEPLDDRVWPRRAEADPEAAVVALSPRTNASHRAVNRLFGRGLALWRAASAFELDGRSFDAGTWLADGRRARALAEEARALHVATTSLPELPEVPLYEIDEPRLGLFKPWRASMDEGWTRWVLETFEFRVTELDNKMVSHGKLASRFDVIVLPSVPRSVIVDGELADGGFQEPLPRPYDGGIGLGGLRALREFVEAGGTLVALSESGQALLQDLEIPVRNAVADLDASEFSIPGTLVRIQVDTSHPLGFGMPRELAAYQRGGPAYVTRPPAGVVSRAVVARYPDDGGPMVLSGWARGGEFLRGRGAIVEIGMGDGKVILMAPRVQHRGQTHATFKLLFNAIHQSAAELRGVR